MRSGLLTQDTKGTADKPLRGISGPAPSPPAWWRPVVVAVLLVAAAVRLHGLDAQSLWYDEGTSVALASRSLLQIAHDAAADIHPPLYYWLLALWTRLSGTSVFAVRAFSALVGTIAVAAVVRLGANLGDRRIGLAAGLSAAASPYLVWYSQEARAYILTAALAAVLALVALSTASAGSSRSRRAAFAGGLLSAGALYSHYLSGAIAVAIGNLAFVARLATRPSRPKNALRNWIVSQAAAGLAFLPWLYFARRSLTAWPAVSPPVSIGFAVRRALAVLAVGTGLNREPPPLLAGLGGIAPTQAPLLQQAIVLIFGIVALAGAIALTRRGALGAVSGLLATCMAAAAPLAIWLVSLRRPAWNPKFLAPSAPGFEILLGAGVVALAAAAGRRVADQRAWSLRAFAPPRVTPAEHGGRWDGPESGRPGPPSRTKAGTERPPGIALGSLLALGVLLLGPRLLVLATVATDPGQQRDDYRGIARDIAALSAPGDAVILDAPTQIEVFGFYAPDNMDLVPLPNARPPDPAALRRNLDAIGQDRDDLFAVLWATDEADPDSLVEAWLDAHRFKAWDRWYGNVRLGLWARPRGPLTDLALPGLQFGDGPTLAGVALDGRNLVPGDTLCLLATWEVAGDPPAGLVAFAQLISAEGQVVAGRDLPARFGEVGDLPAAKTTVTSRPSEGSSVDALPASPEGSTTAPAPPSAASTDVRRRVDGVGLTVPPDLAPGDYTLLFGLYDGATGARLPIDALGDLPAGLVRPDRALDLGTLHVTSR